MARLRMSLAQSTVQTDRKSKSGGRETPFRAEGFDRDGDSLGDPSELEPFVSGRGIEVHIERISRQIDCY
jgi:hypothetical protein